MIVGGKNGKGWQKFGENVLNETERESRAKMEDKGSIGNGNGKERRMGRKGIGYGKKEEEEEE